MQLDFRIPPGRHRLAREPLLHFAVAGALLYGAHAWLAGGSSHGGDSPVVRITRGQVDWLEDSWHRQWQRPPSGKEIRGLVSDFLEEELLYREARELELDENDTIVRRRLAQKMRFLVEDTARPEDPSEDALRRIHAAQPDRFARPARASFTHIFFSRERRGESAERAAAELLERLSGIEGGAGDPEGGDPFLLERDFVLEEEPSIASIFGGEFAKTVVDLEPGRWQGPIVSGYGFHLVRVGERRETSARPFEEVRDQVMEAWRYEEQAAAKERYFDALLEKYEVIADPSVKPLLPPRASERIAP